ncbi:uncharacterized protein LOC135849115 [Planococcus citri]|uniref:uncharacterized protein LOC135849115 n=1 Tax=Planococcus citri TaxID=170843 RepID=UPI0031F9D627
MDPDRAGEWTPQDIADLDKTVFFIKLPTLQEIIYYRLAVEIWNYSRRGRITRLAESYYLNKSKCLEAVDCYKYIETLGIPRPMKEILKSCFKKISEETIRCVIHFKHRLFSNKLDEYKITHVDWAYFVWFPNGQIDYKNTAIKMISSPNLTKEQKFAIMCKYCLENELKTFPLDQLSAKNFFYDVNFNNDPLIYYWICHLRQELHRIPFQEADSIDIEMATKCRIDTCESFEYFWDRLSEQNQVEMMNSRLRACYTVSYEECRLFHKMSHDQQMELLLLQPAEIIIAFLGRLDMPRCAIWAWIHTKHLITDEKFVHIISTLLNSHNEKATNGKIHYDEEKMSALVHIWETATDSQRNTAAANRGFESAIDKILRGPYNLKLNGPYKVSSSGLKLALKFLQMKSSDFRKFFIRNNYVHFLFQTDFDVMNEILELCFPTPSDKESFTNSMEKNLAKLPYCCELLYREDDYDELSQRLQSCFENVNFSSNTIKELIELTILYKYDDKKLAYYTSLYDRSHHVQSEDLEGLRNFINDTLPQYTPSISAIKNSLISSLTTAINPFKQCVLLHELCKVIEVQFVNDHVIDLKHRCVEFFKETNPREWIWFGERFYSVFSWCFDNDREKLPELKHFLPVGDIFYECFRAGNFGGLYPILYVLDECLKYNFADNVDALIRFKMDKKQHPNVQKVFKYFFKNDKLIYEELSQWFNSPDLNSISRLADSNVDTKSPALLVPILSRCNFSG